MFIYMQTAHGEIFLAFIYTTTITTINIVHIIKQN